MSQNRTFLDSAYLEPGSEVQLRAGIPIALGTTIVTVSLSETDDGQMSSFNETVKLSRADREKASQMTERRDETEEKRLRLLRGASELIRVDRAAIIPTDPPLFYFAIHRFPARMANWHSRTGGIPARSRSKSICG
jgi:predicted component of type VI protein secretion system